jgi:MFS family permease
MGTAWRLHLSPLQSLLYFTVVNSLIYLDRGVISVPFTQATLTALAEALDLSASRAGALGSIFILGFMVSSPLFAYWAQTCAPEKLMAGGLVIWSAATLTAGLSLNYWMLLMARAATGIGEASFVCLAPPLILDSAPVAKKTVTIIQLWISIFYAAMTMGYALGFIYGHETMTLIGTWRSPFLIEAGVMFPLILIAFFLKVEGNLPRRHKQSVFTIATHSFGRNAGLFACSGRVSCLCIHSRRTGLLGQQHRAAGLWSQCSHSCSQLRHSHSLLRSGCYSAWISIYGPLTCAYRSTAFT